MNTARIVVRDNASNRVYGPAEILDAEGKLVAFVPEGMHAALCRCGRLRFISARHGATRIGPR